MPDYNIYVTNSGNNNVSIINPEDHTEIGHIPVGISPQGIVRSPIEKKLFVVNYGDDTLSVIDVPSHIVDTISNIIDKPSKITSSPFYLFPEVVYGEVLQSGNIISIYMSKIMEDIIGKQDQFIIKINSNIREINKCWRDVTNNKRFNFLIKGIGIKSSDSVDISYTQGNVKSLDGGILQEFIGYNLINNVLNLNVKAIVANFDDNNINVIDTNTNQILNTITVGGQPHSVAITPDGKSGYISNSLDGTLTVLNLDTGDKSIINVGGEPTALAILPNGQYLYVADFKQGANRVAIIDLSDNTVLDRLSVGIKPTAFGFCSDNSKIYVVNSGSNNVSVIDISLNKVIHNFNVGNNPSAINVLRGGKRAYVTNKDSNNISIVDLVTYSVIGNISVGNKPTSVRCNSLGNRVFVTNSESNTVSVIDPNTDVVIKTIVVGNEPTSIATVPKNTYMYVSNKGSNNVSVINASSYEVVKTIAVGQSPNTVGTSVFCLNPQIGEAEIENPKVIGINTNDTGLVVQVELNKEMLNPKGTQEQFTLNVNGNNRLISEVSLDSNKHILNLTVFGIPLNHTDVITLTYLKGTIKSADGGILESFYNELVNNMDIIAPPEVLSMILESDKIIVSLSKIMINPVGKDSYFTFNVNNGDNLNFIGCWLDVDNIKIILHLDKEINQGDIIKVSYNQEGGVLSADGGKLMSFNNYDVTNTVIDPPELVYALLNTTGNIIKMIFDKVMADPTGKYGEFSYKLEGSESLRFSAIALDNFDDTAINLTISDLPIQGGQTVLLYYVRGTVKSEDGGVLRSFSDIPVMNDVPILPPIPKKAQTDDKGEYITVEFNKDMETPPEGSENDFEFKEDGVVKKFDDITLT